MNLMDLPLCVKGIKKGGSLMHMPTKLKNTKEIFEIACEIFANLNDFDEKFVTRDICFR